MSKEVVNKAKLIRETAEKTKLTRVHTKEVVEAFLDSIATALETNDEVRISGLGTFRVHKCKREDGIKPPVGDVVYVGEFKFVTFQAFLPLKNRINAKKK